MPLSPSTNDWKILAEAAVWLHEAKSWRDLAKRSPAILEKVIGADLCCWNEVDHAINLPHLEMSEPYQHEVNGLLSVLLDLLPTHPLLPDKKAVTAWPEVSQISDVISQAKFENSGLYKDAFSHLESRYQLMGQPYLSANFTVLFSINRKHRDFDSRDRDLFEVLLGHYRIACQNLQFQDNIETRLHVFEEYVAGNTGVIHLSHDGKILDMNPFVRRLIDLHFPDLKHEFLGECQNIAIRTNLVRSQTFQLPSQDLSSKLDLTVFGNQINRQCTILIRESGETSAQTLEHFERLTNREREVLRWIAEGKSNSEIAIILGISTRTIEKHCQNIFEKLGVENRFSAGIMFSRK